MKTVIMVLCLSLTAAAMMARAQEIIALSEDDSARLGLVFAPAMEMDGASGSSYPGMVVNAPDSAAGLVSLHEGIVESWSRMPGDSIQAGEPLLILRSQTLMALQQHWIDSGIALESAQFALQKDQSLFNEGVISRQRLSQTQRQHDQASSSERTAREQLARAGFDAASLTRLRQSGEGLGLYPIRAPATGELLNRMVNVGDQVAAQQVVGNLRSGDRQWLRVEIPATLAVTLRLGQTLSTSAGASTLSLRQIPRQVEARRQTVMIMAEFDDDVPYLPGQAMPVLVPPGGGGVLVPASAVVYNGLETTVYVASSEGVEARVLSLLPVGADYLAVQGLQAGEQVVVSGASLLKGIQLGLGGAE